MEDTVLELSTARRAIRPASSARTGFSWWMERAWTIPEIASRQQRGEFAASARPITLWWDTSVSRRM
jgi:hypothetical protein